MRSFRPNPSGSLGDLSSGSGRSGNRSSIGRTLESSQSNRSFARDSGAANTRSQLSRRTAESAVNRAAWAEAFRNSRGRSGGEGQLGQAGDDSAASNLNRMNQFRGRDGAGRDGRGSGNTSILSQQLGSNESAIGRRGFRPGMNSFGRTDFATNDQVRNFLNMRDRGGQRSGGGENSNESGIVRGRGIGRDGEGDSNRSRFDNARRIADLNGSGDGGRGERGDRDPNWRGRFNGTGDGSEGRDRITRIDGGGGNRRDGDFNFGDGDRNGRNRDGGWQKWRGGDLGKGDHRDWSGRWRDGKRFDVAHNIRNHWRGRDWKDHHDVPFHGDWWRHHGHHRHHHHHHWGHSWWNNWGWYASFHNRPYYWWNWCSAPRLRTWFAFDWATPYYWDYGPGEYIHCDDNVIYVNGQWFAPAPVYYEQTVQLAESAPVIAPEQAAQVEWLPLGVFAVSRDGVVDKNLMVQLAVTKDGVISGTALNQATGATFDIAGSVDKQTQRAAWTYVDETGKRIAMETSVFNLTQPESTALLQNGPEDMKVVELVRLEEPKAEADAAAATGAGAATVAKPQAATRTSSRGAVAVADSSGACAVDDTSVSAKKKAAGGSGRRPRGCSFKTRAIKLGAGSWSR